LPEIEPGEQAEICGDGKDNDCDGDVDADDSDCFECQPGQVDSVSCSTGDVGVCAAGSKERTCGANGQWGSYGSCEQNQAAGVEICADGLDNDCDGDVDSDDSDCVQCVETNNTETIRSMDVSSKTLGQRLKSLGREYRRLASNRTDKRWGRNAQISSVSLANDAWTLAWKLPAKTVSCTASAACETTNFASIANGYSDILSQMKSLRDELEKRLRATHRKGRLTQYATQKLAEFDSAFSTGTQNVQQVPKTTDVCDI
jgi:hypothetical protein